MAFYRAAIGGGGGYSDYAVINSSTAANSRISSVNLTGLTVGNKYLLLLFDSRTSSQSYTKMDGASCSGGTLTSIDHLQSTNAPAQGTFYKLVPSSSSCTITFPNQGCYILVEAQ